MFSRRWVTAMSLLVFGLVVWAQDASEIGELEFRGAAISDILLVLADVANESIIPDETVQGTATYFFSDVSFEQALSGFLEAVGLYAEERNGIYYVSRIRSNYHDETGELTLIAQEVELPLLYQAVAREIGRTVLYDRVPPATVTINANDVPVGTVLEILTRQLPDFEVVDEGEYFYIQSVAQGAGADTTRRRGGAPVTRQGDLYEISVPQARSSELVAELFDAAGVEYVSFAQADSLIQNLYISPKPFDEALRFVLDQAGLDVVDEDGVYVLLDLQRRDVLKRFQPIEVVELEHLRATEFPNLLPSDLGGADLYRLDQIGNRIIFSGTPQEIGPLVEFLESIDQPNTAFSYHRFDLNYVGAQEAIQALPQRFARENPQIVPGSNSLVVALSKSMAGELESFLALLDRPAESVPIRLRYIQAQALLENLPPGVVPEDLVASVDPTLVFFVGSRARQEELRRHLELIDRPVPQIRYQLLVIQFQESDGTSFDFSVSNSEAEDGASFSDSFFLGTIGRLLSLNFDIVSTFGYQFAVQLSAELVDSRASVMADTTLNGLSGQEIRFQNTNTFRYRDIEIDPDTGEARNTGVTREITSGLILTINGWTSGDGMITMDVGATVSSRGSDSGTAGGNPPPTSERIVNTHVRSESGEPIVIGGLIQQNEDVGTRRTPLLSRIPLLGRLFQRRNASVDRTELVIYIVPHVSQATTPVDSAALRVQSLYERLVVPRLPARASGAQTE
ncbi:MAG: hypothetical protein ACOC8L_10015 [Spirochaetota bacterium]